MFGVGNNKLNNSIKKKQVLKNMVATVNKTNFAISGHGGWLMELW